MAEILEDNSKQKSRRKIHNIKVDLTPMVDLGFLLITFFVITTSLRTPKIAKLIMPKDTNVATPIKESNVLTVRLLADDKLEFFFGQLSTGHIRSGGFSDIRNVIIQKQKLVAKTTGDEKNMVLVIEPGNDSNYKNLVDMLDEVMINDIRHYYIVNAPN